MLVAKRYGNQLQDIQSFVRPNELFFENNGEVLDAVELGQAHRTDPSEHAAWLHWDWVCRSIQYPPHVNLASADYHQQEAFLRLQPFPLGGLKRDISYDFWQYPYETLHALMGDCEDSAFLLASMLLQSGAAEDAWVAIGLWEQYGHAWTSVAESGIKYVFETAIESAPAFQTNPFRIPEAPPYYPMLWVNHKEVVWAPGMTPQTFGTGIMTRAMVADIRKAYEPIMTGSFIKEIQSEYQQLGV